MLGLPDSVRGCLFDLDGVLTKTAKVHAAAWKQMFDRFLRDWSAGLDWDRRPPGPAIPPETVAATRDRYLELYTRLTGP